MMNDVNFFVKPTLALAIWAISSDLLVAAETNKSPGAKIPQRPNIPEMVQADGKLRLTFGEKKLVMPRGLQPSMLCTKSGTLIVQAQIPEKSLPSSRMAYPSALETWISRDNAQTWTKIPVKPGKNGLNAEGGLLQLRDGTILALDTYIVPGKKPGEGVGQLYTSTNDWRTVEGPTDVPFDLPKVNFYASKEDRKSVV